MRPFYGGLLAPPTAASTGSSREKLVPARLPAAARGAVGERKQAGPAAAGAHAVLRAPPGGRTGSPCGRPGIGNRSWVDSSPPFSSW